MLPRGKTIGTTLLRSARLCVQFFGSTLDTIDPHAKTEGGERAWAPSVQTRVRRTRCSARDWPNLLAVGRRCDEIAPAKQQSTRLTKEEDSAYTEST